VAEATPPEATKPVETAPVADGAKPDVEPKKVPDEAYVRTLRKEAADNRKALQEAQQRLSELEDRDKSELEKATQRASASEARAVEAEATLIRVEVAAARNLPASAVALLTGTTREEIEASAGLLAGFIDETKKTPPSFDGGARRDQPDEKKPPAQAHNDWLLAALGRGSS
jgi:hypothetical protein